MADILEICKFIQSSKSWSTVKLNLTKLKTLLLSECNIAHETIEDELYEILSKWCYEMGTDATIDILDKCLEELGCRQLVGKSWFHSF